LTDQFIMRCRVVSLLLATQLSLGCFALDLIDEGQVEMERYSGGSKKSESETATPATEEEKKPTRAELQKWWAGAKTISPGSADSGMVSCTIRGKTQFTTRTDCLTRGGRTSGGG
jgi:hypothetical protein